MPDDLSMDEVHEYLRQSRRRCWSDQTPSIVCEPTWCEQLSARLGRLIASPHRSLTTEERRGVLARGYKIGSSVQVVDGVAFPGSNVIGFALGTAVVNSLHMGSMAAFCRAVREGGLHTLEGGLPLPWRFESRLGLKIVGVALLDHRTTRIKTAHVTRGGAPHWYSKVGEKVIAHAITDLTLEKPAEVRTYHCFAYEESDEEPEN